MKRKIWIGFLLGLISSPLTAEENRVALVGHVPAQIKGAALLGRAPAAEQVPLSLVVQIDPVLMQQTLDQLYGPNAPANKRFLSSAEFAQKFGLADKRKALKDFALANGLAIRSAEDRPESMVVGVSGDVGVVEKAFGVQLQQYRAADNQVFRAPGTEPTVPVSLKPHLSAVLGLSNLRIPLQPRVQFAKASSPVSPRVLTGATGPAGGLAPADVKTLYNLTSVPLDGTGQTVALLQFNGFDPADVAAYQTQFGLPNRPVTFISVDGFPNLCDGVPCGPDPTPSFGVAEVVLDIQMVKAVAPNAQILAYSAPATFQGALDVIDQIATDNIAQVISTSWGGDEVTLGTPFILSEFPIFQRMALQGQSMFASSGDAGAFGRAPFGDLTNPVVGDPDSQPYVTAVGGTTLSGSILSYTESTWNNAPEIFASGGGVSLVWPIPNYQVGVPGTFSKQARNVPDVALNADPNTGYAVFVTGTWYKVGGTSAASPLWAGFTALVNHKRLSSGKGLLGFASPTLYQLATSAAYHTLFNDITTGNNGYYNAGVGYDNTTGLGSFKGSALLDAAATALTLSGTSGLSNVYAYPNPWDTRRNSVHRMTFANLPDGATVKIFTISGFLVKTLTASNARAIWDLTNNSGDVVASGLYLYLASNGSDHVSGQIAIIK